MPDGAGQELLQQLKRDQVTPERIDIPEGQIYHSKNRRIKQTQPQKIKHPC